MSADELAAVVAELGALPMPVPVVPEPRTLDVVEHELTGARLSLYEEELETARLRLALASAQRGRRELRELVRQMVEALNCYDCPPPNEAPLDTASRWRGYLATVEARVTELESGQAADGSYLPALPWAALMDGEDLAGFLDELAASAIVHATSEVALAEVERACGTWRLVAEGQHGHNAAPGPDAVTTVFVPVASLREPEPEVYGLVHHDYRVGHDLPETGGLQ